MELYEKKDDVKVEVNGAKLVGLFAGALLGLTAAAALDALVIWAILTWLVGASFSFMQVFGVMLIFKGLFAQFTYFNKK